MYSRNKTEKKEEDFEEIVNLAELLFPNKTFFGQDGITQEFSEFKHDESSYSISVKVTPKGGSTFTVVDKFIRTPEGTKVIEIIPDQEETQYNVTISDDRRLVVSSLNPSSLFVSRECTIENGKTHCYKNIKDEVGQIQTISYEEISPLQNRPMG